MRPAHEAARDESRSAQLRTHAPWLWYLGPVLALLVAPVVVSLIGPAAVSESGPIENLQVVCWLASAGIAFFGASRPRRPRQRLWLIGMGVLALAASARELDLHTMLNPETLGSWGVRYRIDWWIDGSKPILPKLMWAVGGLGVIVMLVVPLLLSVTPWRSRFRPRPLTKTLLVVAVAGMFGGWATDDLFRSALQKDKHWSVPLEESFELMAPTAYGLALCAVVAPVGSHRED